MGTVLNYGIVVKLTLTNLLDHEIYLSGLRAIERGLLSNEPAQDAACRRSELGFTKFTTAEGLCCLYSKALDFVFWDYEGFFDLTTRSMLPGYQLMPRGRTLPIAYVAYRSFFAERPSKEAPESILVAVNAGNRQVVEEVQLKQARWEPRLGSLPEFKELGVPIPSKP
jgi:hypothetical protein